ncbi:uncharacterized protein N7529_004821 [Penicillium soppii]|uniref:uncharacterized protein n=1 Tax=Penicillium soppii TaxID=69789 RepID=UPI00254864C5|nr:uncharacterized protein N7529_004821 [Penicillium soppii]KAJ5872468.1 hypothetical protein N7529_004821 [Penicillium soppii]
MAAPPPDSSYTPPDTPVNEAPFDNDSMEDLDPQATRKRPRLDSGSGVSPTLSMDGTSRTASVAPASDMDEASDFERPASKVTLNMKSPIPSNSAPSEPNIPENDREVQADTDMAPNVICLSSSPSTPRSPQIEVAEPEDIDQESSTSTWRPLDKVLQDQNEPEVIEIEDTIHFADTFPKLDDELRHRENLKAISDMIETGKKNITQWEGSIRRILTHITGHQRESVVLATVQRWMNTCVKKLDRLTLEEFTSDLEFWENLPLIVERLLRRQIDLHLDGVEDLWSFLEDFFLNYSRIVLHLVRLDSAVLSRFTGDANIDPPLSTSRRYLQTFSWVFNSPNTPFYVALHSRYRAQTLGFIARLKDQVTSLPFDAPGALMQYASHVLALVPKCPQVFTILPFVVSNSVVFYECDQGLSSSPADSASLQSFYETARAFDKVYQTFVTKKSQLVTSDMNLNVLSSLSRAYSLLCSADPDFMLQLAKELAMKLPEDTDPEQTRMCVVWTWKFDALKRQAMEGRMELRVNGVETMQSDLVSFWSNHVSHHNNAPFVQHMVQFLRENKILEYLMSVDSHPQLIGRSSNIFGFLIVTGTYDDYITDVIWKAITDSQDDRTVSEIVAMLARTLPMHTSRSKALLYVCSKLLEFPLERYDAQIIDLCEQLVPRMQEMYYDRDYGVMTNGDHVDAIPLKLCVRLIRESAGAEDLPVEKKEIMQEFGSRQLVQFIKAGLSPSDKAETYERCIQDIAEMNACTAGSIQVLNALVSRDDTELWKLAHDLDLTRLVITELHHLVDQGHESSKDLSLQHGFASRVELLRRLIQFAPDTITPELGNIVWKQILMSDKLAHEERQIIWKMAEATLHTAKLNPFIERCIHEYLPEVLPKYYSREVLCFAQQTVFYDIRIKAPPIVGEDEVISVPGMDRIWNFILTAPPHTIETDAIKFAIDLYLDHAIISRAPDRLLMLPMLLLLVVVWTS